MILGWAKLENAIIGDYTYISGTEIWWIISRFSNVEIGKFCSIAHNVEILTDDNHNTTHISTYPFKTIPVSPFFDENQKLQYKKVIIWNDVWIGSGVKIIGNVKIGDGAIIAAGAVVTKDVEPYSIVWWIPAKMIKKRFSDDCISYLQKLEWWNKDIEEIWKNLHFLQNWEWKIPWKK